MATKGVTVKVRELEAFATRLDDLAGAELGKQVVGALNEVVDRTYDLARNRINAGINLTDDYVRRKTRVRHATESRPVAEIAAGTSVDDSPNVPLRNYGAKEIRKVSKVPPGRQGPRKTATPWGQKSDGVRVEVTRGSQKRVATGFMIPLRAGKVFGGNGLGVFRRYGNGKNEIEHLYGPSVYQLFKVQINNSDFIEDIEADMSKTLIDYAQAELQKVIE